MLSAIMANTTTYWAQSSWTRQHAQRSHHEQQLLSKSYYNSIYVFQSHRTVFEVNSRMLRYFILKKVHINDVFWFNDDGKYEFLISNFIKIMGNLVFLMVFIDFYITYDPKRSNIYTYINRYIHCLNICMYCHQWNYWRLTRSVLVCGHERGQCIPSPPHTKLFDCNLSPITTDLSSQTLKPTITHINNASKL